MNGHDINLLSNRNSFLYIEHSKVNVKGNSIEINNAEQQLSIPINSVLSLILGPGTSITHASHVLLFKYNVTICWMGENGLIFYGQSKSVTAKTDNLLKQIACYSDVDKRLNIAREMYQKRFKEDVSSCSIDELRGKEGFRVKTLYSSLSSEYGVKWTGRDFKPGQKGYADNVNKLLSISNSFLYAICNAAIISLGYSPDIGFVHTGNSLSFVYDISDLYKGNYTIPLSFKIASDWQKDNGIDIYKEIRRSMQERFTKEKLLDKIVDDLEEFFK